MKTERGNRTNKISIVSCANMLFIFAFVFFFFLSEVSGTVVVHGTYQCHKIEQIVSFFGNVNI